MKKRVIKYTILLLIIPIIFTIILGCSEYGKKIDYDKSAYNKNESDYVDTLYLPKYKEDTYEYEVKRSDTYIYMSIIGLFLIGGLTYVFFVMKRDD